MSRISTAVSDCLMREQKKWAAIWRDTFQCSKMKVIDSSDMLKCTPVHRDQFTVPQPSLTEAVPLLGYNALSFGFPQNHPCETLLQLPSVQKSRAGKVLLSLGFSQRNRTEHISFTILRFRVLLPNGSFPKDKKFYRPC